MNDVKPHYSDYENEKVMNFVNTDKSRLYTLRYPFCT